MTTRKPSGADKQYKELHELSHDELEALLAREEALLANGTAARLPDGGEKIKKTIEKIKQLLETSPAADLAKAMGSMSIRTSAQQHPPQAKPVAELRDDAMETGTPPMSPAQQPMSTDLIQTGTNASSSDIDFTDAASSDLLKKRILVNKLIEEKEDEFLAQKRKETLDLFVRGRRGINSAKKNPHYGVVPIGLEETVTLRDAWRKANGLPDEDEAAIPKYQLESGAANPDEEYEDEDADPGMLIEEMAGVEQGDAEERKPRRRPARKVKQEQQEPEKPQQPVWDVQEDMKDILDMIPDQYKQPQPK